MGQWKNLIMIDRKPRECIYYRCGNRIGIDACESNWILSFSNYLNLFSIWKTSMNTPPLIICKLNSRWPQHGKCADNSYSFRVKLNVHVHIIIDLLLFLKAFFIQSVELEHVINIIAISMNKFYCVSFYSTLFFLLPTDWNVPKYEWRFFKVINHN